MLPLVKYYVKKKRLKMTGIKGGERMDYQQFLKDITAIIERVLDEKLDEKLDRRFAEFEARMDEKLDRRFAEFEARMDEKLDRRFAEFEVRMDEKLDRRFAEFEVRMDHKMDVKLAPIIKDLAELKAQNAEEHRRLELAITHVDQKVDKLYSVIALANELLQGGNEPVSTILNKKQPVLA